MNKWQWKEYVEWKSIEDICKISKGKLLANQAELNGMYPFFTCAKTEKFINTYTYDCEAILIFTGGDIGRIKYYNGKFNASTQICVLTNVLPEINIKYLYNYLTCYFYNYAKKNNRSMTIPNLNIDSIKSFIVPIPPIEDQEYLADIYSKQCNTETEVVNQIENNSVFHQQFSREYQNKLLSFINKETN